MLSFVLVIQRRICNSNLRQRVAVCWGVVFPFWPHPMQSNAILVGLVCSWLSGRRISKPWQQWSTQSYRSTSFSLGRRSGQSCAQSPLSVLCTHVLPYFWLQPHVIAAHSVQIWNLFRRSITAGCFEFQALFNKLLWIVSGFGRRAWAKGTGTLFSILNDRLFSMKSCWV